ncbi:MAG: transglutaminase domain-containing protein [Aquificaceae bacterium]|nr:transglutaminase domain-containing protein [Aquificaceae bacterium]
MDRRAFIKLTFSGLAYSIVPFKFAQGLQNSKLIRLNYSLELTQKGFFRIWHPVPMSTFYQRLLDIEVRGNPSRVRITQDEVYRAPILYMEFHGHEDKKLANVDFYVEIGEREAIAWNKLPSSNSKIPPEVAFYLKPTTHIQTDGIVRDYAMRITRGRKTDLEKVKAIYDWVVENTFRDPKVLGCGTGDVKTMLESGYFGGKCTDINSLFVALCRASGVPAREIFGIRVLPSRLSRGISSVEGDATKAQHCRAEFYIGRWIPADPADVRKLMLEEGLNLNHPKVKEVRSFMFGGWDVHWIAFNYARDFRLKPPTKDDEPINEFMYPIAELEGRIIDRYRLTFEHSRYTVEALL